MSFQQKKYQVIRHAISGELADFVFKYFLLKRDAVAFLLENKLISEQTPLCGTWADEQVSDTYSHYADFAMETLLTETLPKMKKETGLRLIPTYSYARIYKKGDILLRHKDRPSCEISATLHLGGDEWPIYVDPTGADSVAVGPQKNNSREDPYKNENSAFEGIAVTLKQGDMMIYSGCEIDHWRTPFGGETCAQVFLHYNHADGPFSESNKFDKRPILGIPK